MTSDDARPNRAIVERWADAMSRADVSAFDEVVADDVVEDYPQSGERFRGRDNLRALLMSFPGVGEDLRPHPERVVGGGDEWVMTPGYTLVRVEGGGDEFTVAGTITYPTGDTWHLVQLVEVRSGKIGRLTSYFAEPFEAPDWRAPYREPRA